MSNKKKSETTEAVETEEITEVTETVVEVSNEIKPRAEIHNADFCVYIGPTILGVIQKGTIYAGNKNDVEEQLANAIEKYPSIKYLIAEDWELAKKNEEAKKKGTFLYEAYKDVLKK